MSASYPSSAKSFTALNVGDTIQDTDTEQAYDEITALETALLTGGLEHNLFPDASASARTLGTSTKAWGLSYLKALILSAASELTIASGVVTASQGYHKIDTEGDAASDDLDTITAGTGITEGALLVLRAENTARVVTLKDGSGNLLLSGDFALSTTDKLLFAIYDGTNWREIARSGGGSGKPVLVFTATSNVPPSSAYATPDTRNSHAVLDFDGSTDEEAVFGGVLPAAYGSGGLTVDLYVAFTSATSGSVRFQVGFERIDASSLDIDADSFASFQSAGGTAPGTSGQVIKISIAFTDGAQMDSLVGGEAFRVKVRRDADGTSGTDDIATDCELLRVVVREP